eukprot:CAMPEP_0178913682 /NCGR_PEP_ID=MMETSP0786-20121207/10982_1 /TAXON_ID=186022 /ORGANISM="Thalassionema frauenfeldii, Strain CCMP 1798" /LENGTH=247 /DNA_ID=CAMNT_0020586459 /DNA_START=237 /DNA_END=980 /DNA_ORIENTATION=+
MPSRTEGGTTRRNAYKEATFGMGCFWAPSESLLQVEGVLDTVVGYAGGSLSGKKPIKNPSYDDVCYGDAWVEAVRVLYDDDQVSFETLLDRFFELQNPVVGNRQYESIIFPHDDSQKEIADSWKAGTQQLPSIRNDGLPTSIVNIEYNDDEESPLLFYKAEDYHQEYWQKWRPRIAGGIGLLSIASGIFAPILSTEQESQVKTCSALLFILGALYFGVLERLFGGNTRELEIGSLAKKAYYPKTPSF